MADEFIGKQTNNRPTVPIIDSWLKLADYGLLLTIVVPADRGEFAL